MVFLVGKKLDRKTCFICGKPASTVEHVFPKWLQTRFNLWNKHLQLPNFTRIPYKQLTVPACSKCNNEVYSKLENKVRNNTATETDIWKWANKIHYSLEFKDHFLEWDRQHPGYKIGDVLRLPDPLQVDRHLLHGVAGNFSTNPSPFGSVFKFIFKEPQNFCFNHVKLFASICISVGKIGYICFVKDGLTLKQTPSVMEAYKKIKKGYTADDMLYFYALCLDFSHRYTPGFDTIMTQRGIIKSGPTIFHENKEPNKEEFNRLCNYLGIPFPENDDIGQSNH